MQTISITDQVPVSGRYDVIVAGGGLAGVAAALAARRSGKSVLVTEKTTLLGGLATIGLVNYFVPMCNGRGKQVIRGIAEELLRMSIKYGWDTLPAEWRDGEPRQATNVRYVTRFSPNIFALQLTELLTDAGIDLLFDCMATKPVMNGKHCDGVVTESKSGREFYAADMVIDTTGDADLLYRAGVPTAQGKNYFIYYCKTVTLEACKKAIEKGNIAFAYDGECGGNINLHGDNQPADIPLYEGTNVRDVSDYLIRNQRLMLGKFKKKNRLEQDIATLPTMPQFRTPRHIVGGHVLTENDLYRHFPDSIAAICDFERRDFLYEVPLRALVCDGYDNLLTAGRSAAAEGFAWDILRVIPPAIATGQAAGMAAALALDSKRAVAEVDIATLQDRLRKADVTVHFDDAWVPADRGAAKDAYDATQTEN